MSKPIAVLISDVHYNIHTLPLADKAMRMAIDKANSLGVPLIVAGDLHDTKANLRGECVSAMLSTMRTAKYSPIVLIGNHDKINEKSKEHALDFLHGICIPIETPIEFHPYGWLIPYQHDPEFLKSYLRKIPKNSTIIMHQGISGSEAGEYIHDKSAISTDDIKDFRVISGHYHTRQDIKCGRPRKGAVGLASYIGNPYTLNFAEARDPEKGLQILHDDGLLEFVPTNLRKHVVIEHDLATDINLWTSGPIHAGGGRNDLVWVKISGTREQLSTFNKVEWLRDKGIPQNTRIDLIPTDSTTGKTKLNLTQPELLDSMIQSLTNVSDECKVRVKSLWKGLCE